MAADGTSNNAIASRLGIYRSTVILWRSRFKEQGCPGISADAPHGVSSRRLDPEKDKAIVNATLQTKPAGATQWSTRLMARAQGVSKSTVQRIWDAHGLQPHRIETFKLSRDKHFVEKLTDVVGVYLNPPDKAVVLCMDEKSQIQALNRTQPGLPMKRGRCGTMTHDYKRNGTTCLFAALNILEGKVIGSCFPRHRHIEFLRFLRTVDRQVPRKLDIHAILDNYGTHRHPKVRTWLANHPRFHLHFVPTSSSWLNLVERWFGEITRRRIRRGSFNSTRELIDAIHEYIQLNNENPKPFVWTKKADDILQKLNRCKAVIGTLH
jgi:transposase